MSQLQTAMKAVDTGATGTSLPRAVVATAASVAADTETARLAAAEAEVIALNAADAAMAAAASDAARRDAETHADAVRVVLRAKAREGHDLTAMRPADAQAVDIIRRALDGVRHAANVKIDDVFNAASTSADIARGSAVAAAISEGE